MDVVLDRRNIKAQLNQRTTSCNQDGIDEPSKKSHFGRTTYDPCSQAIQFIIVAIYNPCRCFGFGHSSTQQLEPNELDASKIMEWEEQTCAIRGDEETFEIGVPSKHKLI